ncbi:MAG: hypothetical protein LQ342_004644 [Letrouitia transgressa]|nr:MAG: hypothetical protein LQ342_004644 [Letrouitia transgressa]
MGWIWSTTVAPKQSEPRKQTLPVPIAPLDPSLPPDDAFNDSTPLDTDEQTNVQIADGRESTAQLRRVLGYPGPGPEEKSAKLARAKAAGIITPANLYPDTMSCRAAFDQAFFCQSPGGHFMNVYRYGSLRDCRELWSHFWFCLRTNRGFVGEEEKKERIRSRYMKREKKYRDGPSSEDIWQQRTRIVEDAFNGDLEADMKAWEEEQKRFGEKGA